MNQIVLVTEVKGRLRRIGVNRIRRVIDTLEQHGKVSTGLESMGIIDLGRKAGRAPRPLSFTAVSTADRGPSRTAQRGLTGTVGKTTAASDLRAERSGKCMMIVAKSAQLYSLRLRRGGLINLPTAFYSSPLFMGDL
jgi:hypothetical protein